MGRGALAEAPILRAWVVAIGSGVLCSSRLVSEDLRVGVLFPTSELITRARRTGVPSSIDCTDGVVVLVLDEAVPLLVLVLTGPRC